MERPSPDRLPREPGSEVIRRGRLKIFLGYASGTGKTYAMLEAARAAAKAGIDTVAGFVAPHTRPETLALLDGLEQLPPLRAGQMQEFDLDGAIARAPELILVDELAHTNADGCRRRKRFQDVQELLKAGINVYTTVDIQHIESLGDAAASITGMPAGERVPDSVIDSADQVELVDRDPAFLLERLREGGGIPDARSGAYKNLAALRELALRRTADLAGRAARREPAREKECCAEEHILICLSASPSSGRVIRSAARMAEAFHGLFTALFVDSEASREASGEGRKRLRENLRLAEQLGARIVTVFGENVPEQIAEYARISGVTKLVLGRSNGRRRFLRGPGLAEQLTAMLPEMDIYIIPDTLPSYAGGVRRPKRPVLGLADSVKTVLIILVVSVVGLWYFDTLGFREDANIVTLYILGVLLVALTTQGRIYGIAASVCSVLIFNYLFTVPRGTFEAVDPGYPLTFIVMFIAACITSTLTMRIKEQTRMAVQKAHHTQVLLETSQKLQLAEGFDEICRAAADQMRKLADRTVLVYPVRGGALGDPVFAPGEEADRSAYTAGEERAVAAWVCRNSKRAGAGTDTFPGAKCQYLAVRSHDTVFAVAAVTMDSRTGELEVYEKNLLLAMLGECAMALEKAVLDESKKQIALQAQQEQLRANLLRAISHDLRTPLTSISGSAGILIDNGAVLDEDKKQRLYMDIYDDAMWLISMVENLLSVTRLENGSMQMHIAPELLEDVIREALEHVGRRRGEHRISVEAADELLMARMDSRLIMQVIVNLVDNAIKYTQPDSHIRIRTARTGRLAAVEISDDGPGIPEENKNQLFDMFYTVGNRSGDNRRSLGLGLALCRSIVTAHGGTISVRDSAPHGASFVFTLPAEEVTL